MTSLPALGAARPQKRRLGILAAVVAVLVGFALSPPAYAGPGEGDFFKRCNSARASSRLHAYVSKADLVTAARQHAERMAKQGRLFHNPNLGREVKNWRAVGENVGRGRSVAAIHDGFMKSTSHRANILDKRFTEVGMGTFVDPGGVIYVVQVFRQPK